jgi:RNase P/RNase MRP subunit p29
MLEHDEFIGRPCRVVSSRDTGMTRIEGVIIDETRQMVHIRTNSGLRMIPKHGTVFEIDGHRVQGDDVMFRPEDRIKRVRIKARDRGERDA